MSTQAEAGGGSALLDPGAGSRFAAVAERVGRIGLGAGTIVLVLVLWELSIRLLHVPIYIVPAPSVFLAEMVKQAPLLLSSSVITSYEILLGFLAGSIGGGILGIVIYRYPLAAAALNPLVIFFQIIPKIALAPIFLLWFGFGYGPKILLVAVIAFFPVTLNTLAGLASTNPDLGSLVRSVGGTRGQLLWRVEVPSALPEIFAGLKIAMTFSVIGAVVGEFTGASEGLGYLILFSSSQVQTPLLFASLFAIAALGLMMYYLIVLAEYIVVPWRR